MFMPPTRTARDTARRRPTTRTARDKARRRPTTRTARDKARRRPRDAEFASSDRAAPGERPASPHMTRAAPSLTLEHKPSFLGSAILGINIFGCLQFLYCVFSFLQASHRSQTALTFNDVSAVGNFLVT